MRQKRVAVIRGGVGQEYAHSMKTGGEVIGVLNELGYHNKDIVITKNGEWLDGGYVKTPLNTLEGFDVVLILIRGEMSEDGEIQKVIKNIGLPYTGSESHSTATAFNKRLTKNILLQHGIIMPRHKVVGQKDISSLDDVVESIVENFGHEYMIKPTRSGSSSNVVFANSPDSLRSTITNLLHLTDSIMVEEYIRGREATVATMEYFRNENIYTFPSVEILIPHEMTHYDSSSKHSDSIELLAPGRFSLKEREVLSNYAKLIHENLSLSQYSRSDFIVRDNKAYFLEINPLPQINRMSSYAEAAKSAGLSYHDLIDHLVETAKA